MQGDTLTALIIIERDYNLLKFEPIIARINLWTGLAFLNAPEALKPLRFTFIYFAPKVVDRPKLSAHFFFA